MSSINERLYKEYLKKYAEQRGISEGEAEEHALVKETKKYYDNIVIGIDLSSGSDKSSVPFECGDCR